MVSPTPDPTFTVREATRDDLLQVFEVYATVADERLWIGAEGPIEDRDSRIGRWTEQFFVDPKGCMFVAETEEDIVGFATMQWVGAAELGMAILAPYRGFGIGSALLVACIDWANRERIHKIELKVWPHNDSARALYAKFGFEEEGYLTRHYRRRNGELWDCVIMGLQLPAGKEQVG